MEELKIMLITLIGLGIVHWLIGEMLFGEWRRARADRAINCTNDSGKFLYDHRGFFPDWEKWLFSDKRLPELSAAECTLLTEPEPPRIVCTPEKVVCTGYSHTAWGRSNHYKIVQHERRDCEPYIKWRIAQIKQECIEGQQERLAERARLLAQHPGL